MSAPAAEDPDLARMMSRLFRPGMVDVGRIGRDQDRLAAPGLGLGASPTARRLSARGGAGDTPVVQGDMTHVVPPAAGADAGGVEPAPSASGPAATAASPTRAPTPTRVETVVQAATARATSAAAEPAADAGPEPAPAPLGLAEAIERAAASPGPAPSSAAIAARAPIAAATLSALPVAARAAAPATAVGAPIADIAATHGEIAFIPQAAATTPRSQRADDGQDTWGGPVGSPAQTGAAPRSGTAVAPMATPAAITGPPNAIQARTPDVAAIAERVRRDLMRDLAIDTERRGGARWKR